MKPPHELARFAALYECPDCLSSKSDLEQDERGIWHLEVRHDATCPTLASMEQR